MLPGPHHVCLPGGVHMATPGTALPQTCFRCAAGAGPQAPPLGGRALDSGGKASFSVPVKFRSGYHLSFHTCKTDKQLLVP